jgi:hypothetical protein
LHRFRRLCPPNAELIVIDDGSSQLVMCASPSADADAVEGVLAAPSDDHDHRCRAGEVQALAPDGAFAFEVGAERPSDRNSSMARSGARCSDNDICGPWTRDGGGATGPRRWSLVRARAGDVQWSASEQSPDVARRCA